MGGICFSLDMDNTLATPLIAMYFMKKRRLHRQIEEAKFAHQIARQKSHRLKFIRNALIHYWNMLINQSNNVGPRTCWSYLKSGDWWSSVVPIMNDKQFKENFRIQRSTFKEILNQVGPYLRREDTIFRSAIPIEKRVACALYSLGSTSELRTIAHLFGIGRSTAANLLHEFTEIIVQLFFHRLIKFPTTDQAIKDVTDGFLDKYRYPMCLGSVDGTHICIQPPYGEETDYYNYKKYHSVIALGVVDSNLKFTYLNVGAPGRCNDASVYNRCTLGELVRDPIYARNYLTVNNINIQAHLIGDSAFPLSQRLMKPFPERVNMPQAQRYFNYRLSHCRSTIERAFGHVKNRFRSLHKKLEYDLDHTKSIIKAAFILHNICVDAQDSVEIEWNQVRVVYKKTGCAVQSTAAVNIRNALCVFFLQNPL